MSNQASTYANLQERVADLVTRMQRDQSKLSDPSQTYSELEDAFGTLRQDIIGSPMADDLAKSLMDLLAVMLATLGRVRDQVASLKEADSAGDLPATPRASGGKPGGLGPGPHTTKGGTSSVPVPPHS